MSFAERLQKFPPLQIEARTPSHGEGVTLCLPRVLKIDGRGGGILNLELAPLVVGGMGSTRLLSALAELLYEIAAAPDEQMGAHAEELREAWKVLHMHLESIDAASESAHLEHEAHHAAEHSKKNGGVH